MSERLRPGYSTTATITTTASSNRSSTRRRLPTSTPDIARRLIPGVKISPHSVQRSAEPGDWRPQEGHSSVAMMGLNIEGRVRSLQGYCYWLGAGGDRYEATCYWLFAISR